MSSNTLIAEHDGIYVEVVDARFIGAADDPTALAEEAKLDKMIRLCVEKIRDGIGEINDTKRPDTIEVEFSLGFAGGGWVVGSTISASIAVTATWKLK